MKKQTWSEKYRCFECSFCDKPQGSLVIKNEQGWFRYCKEHEKELVLDKPLK